MKPIEIYTAAGCPYSEAAREDLERDEEARGRMRELTGGTRTVPVIFEEGKPVQVGWMGRVCRISHVSCRPPVWRTAPTHVIASSPRQPSGYVGGVVGDNDIGAGAFDARQRFEDGPLFLEPAVLGCGLDHRILPAHVVGGDG
jgi:glutaredoxin 3